MPSCAAVEGLGWKMFRDRSRTKSGWGQVRVLPTGRGFFQISNLRRTTSTFSSDIAHAVSLGRVLLFVRSSSPLCLEGHTNRLGMSR